MYEELITVTVHYNRVREIRDGRLEAARWRTQIALNVRVHPKYEVDITNLSRRADHKCEDDECSQ